MLIKIIMKKILYLILITCLVSCSKSLEHTEVTGNVICVTKISYHDE